MNNPPSAFQKKALWSAITAVSLTVTGAIAIGLIYGGTRVLAFLQPFLVPFAMAGVLAYLLEPGVVKLERLGLTRQRAVLLVFALFSLLIFGLGWWLGVKVVAQSRQMDGKLAVYAGKVRTAVVGFADSVEEKYGIELLPMLRESMQSASQKSGAGTKPAAATVEGPEGGEKPAPENAAAENEEAESSAGFLLSMSIVPLYLYYFLIESARIKQTWSNYLPLRASAFKDEVVDCLTEINSYLIAFFRGQLFVSVVNGIATGIGLMIVGLDFGLLIGLMLCVLGIIPYLGIAVCWIPAVSIAAVQGGSALVPGDPWWALPLVVTIIFVVVQQIDGFFLTPKVVGESVGLHPMTVIVSLVVWSLLLGGLLGAILAVPLTASVKVLFQRYVWLARLAPQTVGGALGGN